MTELNLREFEDRIELQVDVRAGGSKNEIRGIRNGRLKVSVTQVAEKGKANDAVIAILAKTLSVSKSSIHLVQGARSKKKTFEIRNISKVSLIQRCCDN